MFEALTALPEVDATGFLAPRAAAGEPRLAAMIVDPGQFDLGAAIAERLGPLAERGGDPSSDAAFESLLEDTGMKTLLEPRMATHDVHSVRGYIPGMMRYTNAVAVSHIECPSFVTDNETDSVSTGQGRALFERLTCP
jgi:hypothetical protein